VNAADAEIQHDATELEPDRPDLQDVLTRCVQNALSDMLFDAGWDAANNASFDVGREKQTTANRGPQCMADNLGVPLSPGESVADWMLASIVKHRLPCLDSRPCPIGVHQLGCGDGLVQRVG
jgi:hypothetical protein